MSVRMYSSAPTQGTLWWRNNLSLTLKISYFGALLYERLSVSTVVVARHVVAGKGCCTVIGSMHVLVYFVRKKNKDLALNCTVRNAKLQYLGQGEVVE